jgi:hypothetical protein
MVDVPATVLAPNEADPAADFHDLVVEHVQRERVRLIEEGVLTPEPPPDLLAFVARAIRSLPG